MKFRSTQIAHIDSEMDAGLGGLAREHRQQLEGELAQAGAERWELIGFSIAIKPFTPQTIKQFGRAYVRSYKDTFVYRSSREHWEYEVDDLPSEADLTSWMDTLNPCLEARASEGWDLAGYEFLELSLYPFTDEPETESQHVDVQVLVFKRPV